MDQSAQKSDKPDNTVDLTGDTIENKADSSSDSKNKRKHLDDNTNNNSAQWEAFRTALEFGNRKRALPLFATGLVDRGIDTCIPVRITSRRRSPGPIITSAKITSRF